MSANNLNGEIEHHVSEVLLGEEMIIDFVSLRSVQLGEGLRPADGLEKGVCLECLVDNDLEHGLQEQFLFCLSPPLEHNLTEVREVDKAIPGDGVGQVYNFLLHGI